MIMKFNPKRLQDAYDNNEASGEFEETANANFILEFQKIQK